MKYTDTKGLDRNISREEMNAVYSALGTLMTELDKEHVLEYFKRPMHDLKVYESFKHGVSHVRELMGHVASV